MIFWPFAKTTTTTNTGEIKESLVNEEIQRLFYNIHTEHSAQCKLTLRTIITKCMFLIFMWLKSIHVNILSFVTRSSRSGKKDVQPPSLRNKYRDVSCIRIILLKRKAGEIIKTYQFLQ